MAFPYDQTVRDNLIDGQLTPNAVCDPALLEAVRAVPREAFVPEAFHGAAYVDEAIPLGAGRALMEPLVQTRMLQALALRPGDSLLIIGGTTGYTAALASRLVARVEMVEDSAALVTTAQRALAQQQVANVNVVQHTLAQGARGAAPYDAILVEGAVAHIPDALAAQLKEGGRLVAVLRNPKSRSPFSACGTAHLYEKNGESLAACPLFDAGVAALPGFTVSSGFEFNA